jgi:carboxyl-terminal processing protease
MNARLRAGPLAFAVVAAVGLFAGGCADLLVGGDPPTSPASLFEIVWKDFDRNYAAFGVKSVDWAAVRAKYGVKAERAGSLSAVAPIIGEMFTELHDLHVALWTGGSSYYFSVNDSSTRTFFSPNTVFAKYVQTNRQTASRNMRYGMLAPDLGYVWIGSFGGSGWTDEIDGVLESFGSAAGIVVDIRNNGGGSSNTAEAIAARFVDGERTFSYHRWRNGPSHGDLTDYIERRIGPQGRRFSGRIVVLTNRRVVSAAEDFVLAMRSQPGVRFVGDTTAGGLGNPMVRELPNGWVYRLPQWLQYGPAKEVYEGVGIAPHEVIRATASDSVAGRDVQLDRALAVLRVP